MSMLFTAEDMKKGSGSSSGSGDESKCPIAGNWAANVDVCKQVFDASDGSITKTCDRNQRFTFETNPDGTLQGTTSFVALLTGDIKSAPLIGFWDEDKCTFKAVQVLSGVTFEGYLSDDDELFVEATRPGGGSSPALAFQGIFSSTDAECFSEGEECLTDLLPDGEYVNEGCSNTIEEGQDFGSIVPGQSICGAISTYFVGKGKSKRLFRDVDWYEFDHPGGAISATLTANFDEAVLDIVKLGDNSLCTNVTDIAFDEDVVDVTDGQSNLIATSGPVPAGKYALFVSVLFGNEVLFGDGYFCGKGSSADYTLTLVDDGGVPPIGIEAVTALEDSVGDVSRLFAKELKLDQVQKYVCWNSRNV